MAEHSGRAFMRIGIPVVTMSSEYYTSNYSPEDYIELTAFGGNYIKLFNYIDYYDVDYIIDTINKPSVLTMDNRRPQPMIF